MDHSLDDLPVHSPWALVRHDGDVVVVDEAPGHGDLEVVGPEQDGPALATKVRPSGAVEHWSIRAGKAWRRRMDIIHASQMSTIGPWQAIHVHVCLFCRVQREPLTNYMHWSNVNETLF